MSENSRSRLVRLSEQERQALVARLLSNRRSDTGREIVRQPRTSTRFPLSFAQQRIWVLQQLFPRTTGFNVILPFHLRGPLNRAALQQSLADVTRRHEALRTRFELEDGQPVQCIESTFDVVPSVEDLRGLPESERAATVVRRAREEAVRGWDLTAGPPLRVWLWQLADEEHALMLLMHHILCDGWSLNIVMRELFASYRARDAAQAPALPDVPLQYVDFAAWHRQWLESDSLKTQLAFWRRRMGDAPILRLPTNGTDAQRTDALARRVLLSGELARSVKALSRAEGVTTFMTLLAGFSSLLSAYGDQDDIVLGSPVASRTRAELENVVGCFMNPLPFRVDLKGNPTVRQLLARVRDMALEGYANQDVPFDLIVRALRSQRDLGSPPLYQAMFLLHNFPWEFRDARPASSALPALEIKPWPLLNLSEGEETRLAVDRIFPVALELVERADSIAGFVEYAPEFAGVLSRFPEDFLGLMEAAAADPDRRVRDLPIASRADRKSLARPAGKPDQRHAGQGETLVTADDAVDVSRAFEEQVARTPEATAILDGSRRVTYRELNDHVARLAARLQGGLVAPDAAVGVLLERSVDAIAVVLAILRAGGAYLPLDPALPAERLAFMLQQVDVSVVVTRGDLLRDKAIQPRIIEGRTIVRLDDAATAERPEAAPALVSADHLAYVLFTSGSSGRPKAVGIPRGALANYAAVARRRFAIAPHDRVLQFASLSFDTAAEEIFPTLTSGATLVLRNDAMLGSVSFFLAACAEWGITVLDLPTAYWHELTAQIARGALRVPASIRLVILGGEKALAPRVREWRAAVGPKVRLLNTYGPTEAAIVVTMWDVGAAEESGEIPIGLPVANVEALILDRKFQAVPSGSVDELCIGGVQLARGYLNDTALTAEHFVPHPASSVPGARLYRTGDLARERADGALEFAGRRDDQVKLRGYRIEPAEVEAIILHHFAVLETVVAVCRDRAGDPRLVAYVVRFEGSPLTAAELRTFLADRLPEYAVPSAFVFLEKLPRTVQRKVDRDALPPVEWTSAIADTYQSPQTQLERRIAALWAEVLGRDCVSVHDNFFDLGGHSLLVIRLHARLQEELGEELSLVDLFQFPTVSSQAERLARPLARQSALSAAQDRAVRQRQAFQRLRS